MAKKGPSSVQDRLNRIEGQIRGIIRLVDENEPTEKILIQVQAAISSLESVRIELIKIEMKKKLLEELDSVVNLLK